jgi:hypothetical protein
VAPTTPRALDLCVVLLSIVLSPGLALAQMPPGLDDLRPAPPAAAIIGGGAAPGPTFQRCIEVEVGGDRSLGCLNQQLRREVDRVAPRLDLPPLDARSPDVRIGVVNETAVRQQYGSNFGVSAVPFRPPPVTFTLPPR